MTFKKIMIGLVALLLAALIGAAFYVNYFGLIPRQDYDSEAPALPDFTKPAILIFSKTNGFIHHDAIAAANETLTKIAEDKGYQVFITRNGAVHTLEQLQKFDLVVWNNVSDDVLTIEQRAHFENWFKQGGRWLGLHASAGDIKYAWTWYVQELLGAQFIGHTMHPQFTDATLNKVDSNLVITQSIPDPWVVELEEWYAFDRNPQDAGYEILITADESTYNTDPTSWLDFKASMDGIHPLVWRKQMGAGRMFYSAIGHHAYTYELAEYQAILSGAIDWLLEK
jgi:type 1 glutamine amidotransferase